MRAEWRFWRPVAAAWLVLVAVGLSMTCGEDRRQDREAWERSRRPDAPAR